MMALDADVAVAQVVGEDQDHVGLVRRGNGAIGGKAPADPEDSQEPPFTAPSSLVLELLAWVAARPRKYAETMEVWRPSCPRMPVWEDATMNGLVTVVPGDGGIREHAVCLTTEGLAFLQCHSS